MTKTISIARDFSRFPAGRYRGDGPYSGEAFRTDHLLPALEDESESQIVVDLDGTLGYGSSFLEEAFGGLVRVHGLPMKLLERIRLDASDPTLIKEIWGYINDAQVRQGA